MAWEKVSDYNDLPSVSFGEDEGQLGKGESFTGYYKYPKNVTTKYGDKIVHTLQATSGGDIQIWGTSVLNRLLSGVGPGVLVSITYTGLGKKEKGKNPAKMFEMKQDKENTIFVDVPKVSFQDEDSSNDGDDGLFETPPPAAARATPANNGSDKAAASRSRVEAILAGRKSA